MSREDETYESTTRRRQMTKAPEDLFTSDDMSLHGRSSRATTTSMNSIRVSPRTPSRPGRSPIDDDAMVELELNSLDDQSTHDDFYDEENGDALSSYKLKSKATLSSKDKRGMILLIVLYLIQGVPLGLALGSVPFLLREHLSYSQLAIFALSGYPYSLKLLWSPIVDSVFFYNLGRRKSWIIPMQIIIGVLMLWIAYHVEVLLDTPSEHIHFLTFIFTSLVFFSATQDIAVDGWALTLLSEDNLSYASTCQTVGLNTGYFMSFTVFLALNSEAFAEKWGLPRLTLPFYLRCCAILCFSVTFWLIFIEKEEKMSHGDDEVSVQKVYKSMWEICKLRHVQSLIIIHFFCKVGFQANDAVTNLKLVEKGLGREDLALAVLIDFPCQIVGGWLAAKWSIGDKPFRPWIYAAWVRLAFALIWLPIIHAFPNPPISSSFFIMLVILTVLQGFSSTIQFVGISAFHTRISDPLIGGTYMTLLNTFSNLGGTWPRYFVLKGVDYFSVATCRVQEGPDEILLQATECVSDHGKALCTEIGGECITERDGYFYVSILCATFGIIFLVAYVIPVVRKLQALPVQKWRLYAH